MKKIVIMFILLLLTSGCTVVRIDTKNVDNIVSVVLSKNNKLFNHIGKGYKYYIPRGVSYMDSNELNDKLYSSGNYYYLYVDVISYYYKKESDYKVDNSLYYSKPIDINGKTGYLQITKVKSKYLVEFMYNYAKIEAVVNKEDIEKVVLDFSYILSTIKFNNNIVKIMLNTGYFINKEEKYDVFTSKKPNDSFLPYDEGENNNEEVD